MTSFDIYTNNYAEVNQQLFAAVRAVGDVLDELNGVLRNIVDAVDSQATPLWLEQQTRWNSTYQEMAMKLNTGATTSTDVANIFDEGDRRGAQIMSG